MFLNHMFPGNGMHGHPYSRFYKKFQGEEKNSLLKVSPPLLTLPPISKPMPPPQEISVPKTIEDTITRLQDIVLNPKSKDKEKEFHILGHKLLREVALKLNLETPFQIRIVEGSYYLGHLVLHGPGLYIMLEKDIHNPIKEAGPRFYFRKVKDHKTFYPYDNHYYNWKDLNDLSDFLAKVKKVMQTPEQPQKTLSYPAMYDM